MKRISLIIMLQWYQTCKRWDLLGSKWRQWKRWTSIRIWMTLIRVNLWWLKDWVTASPKVNAGYDRSISVHTVHPCLLCVGICCHRLVRVPLLKCLQWTNIRTGPWRQKKMAWSYESCVLLHHVDRRLYACHLPGKDITSGYTMANIKTEYIVCCSCQCSAGKPCENAHECSFDTYYPECTMCVYARTVE